MNIINLSIEAGKRYKRRDGSITPELVLKDNGEGFLMDPQQGWDYDPESDFGHQVVEFKGAMHPHDLIEVYEGDAA